MKPPWERGLHKNGHCHMTKMATMPIYGQTFTIFFFGTRSSMILKLGMDQQGLKVYKVYINEPGLTLIYFRAGSNSVRIAHCAHTRPIVRCAFTWLLVLCFQVSIRNLGWIDPFSYLDLSRQDMKFCRNSS